MFTYRDYRQECRRFFFSDTQSIVYDMITGKIMLRVEICDIFDYQGGKQVRDQFGFMLTGSCCVISEIKMQNKDRLTYSFSVFPISKIKTRPLVNMQKLTCKKYIMYPFHSLPRYGNKYNGHGFLPPRPLLCNENTNMIF